MSHLIIILSLLFITGNTQPDPNTMSISAEGQVELTADIIQFNINLNAEADQPQKVYDLHKEREKALVELLKKYDVQEKNIQYEPISISKVSNGNRYGENEEDRYQTRQAVNLKLDDFEVYEKIQVGLIEHNFDSFNGQFLSSKAEQGKDEALKKAIQIAKEKAQLIAQETGVSLGKITNINYSHNVSVPMYRRSAMEMSASSDQLLQYEPSVTVSASVSINFKILQN